MTRTVKAIGLLLAALVIAANIASYFAVQSELDGLRSDKTSLGTDVEVACTQVETLGRPCAVPIPEQSEPIAGPAGPSGAPGQNGRDGRDGAAAPVVPAPQVTVIPGTPGSDGTDGQDGAPGADGQDGAQGPAGPQGEPGQNGRDGRDGKPPASFTFDSDGITYTCVDPDGDLAYTCLPLATPSPEPTVDFDPALPSP